LEYPGSLLEIKNFIIPLLLQESYFTYAGDQESPVNHDVHFRAGYAPDGTDTFTPRTVIYDFKREFGALRKINDLYNALSDPTQSSAWYD